MEKISPAKPTYPFVVFEGFLGDDRCEIEFAVTPHIFFLERVIGGPDVYPPPPPNKNNNKDKQINIIRK